MGGRGKARLSVQGCLGCIEVLIGKRGDGEEEGREILILVLTIKKETEQPYISSQVSWLTLLIPTLGRQKQADF